MLSSLPPRLQSLLEALRAELAANQPGLIGVSGGVDSSLLAVLASRWQMDYHAVYLTGPHISPQDREQATAFLQDLTLPTYIGRFSPLDDEHIAHNPVSRCYGCKMALLTILKALRRSPHECLVDGSHLSDYEQYRPGQRALQEHGVLTPLAATGWTKADIRQCARALGMAQAELPAKACLMTRFAYDTRIEEQDLIRVGRAEDELARLGLNTFRIRVHPDRDIVLQVLHSEGDLLDRCTFEVQSIMHRYHLAPFRIRLDATVSGYFDKL